MSTTYKAAVALATIIASFGTSIAIAEDGAAIMRSDWQMHDGGEIINFKLTGAGDTNALTQAQIPAADDAGWKATPKDANGNVSIDAKSRLNTCSAQLDFTYFQTFVTVPAGGVPAQLDVSFEKVDDNAQIYVFNNGQEAFKSDPINGSKVNTANLAAHLKEGNNRIVIAQVDTCAVKNTIQNIQVEMAGHVVKTCDPNAVSAHGDFVKSVGDGICPDGTRLATYGEVMQAGQQACGVLAEWDIARLECNGSTDGSGYKCGSRPADNRSLGHSLCVKTQ